MPAKARKSKTIQSTTIRIPVWLYEEATCIVKAGEASSLNDLVLDSLKEKLRKLRRAQIDAAFAQMKNDERYQRHARELAEQFTHSDSETIRATESELV